jgi:hypothetical protein
VALIDHLTKTATLIQRDGSGEVDELGNEIKVPTAITVHCEVQQQQREEPVAAGEASITTWLVIFSPGTVVRTGDALRGVFNERTGTDMGDFEFVGDSWQAESGGEQVWHVEATAKQTRVPGTEAS